MINSEVLNKKEKNQWGVWIEQFSDVYILEQEHTEVQTDTGYNTNAWWVLVFPEWQSESCTIIYVQLATWQTTIQIQKQLT